MTTRAIALVAAISALALTACGGLPFTHSTDAGAGAPRAPVKVAVVDAFTGSPSPWATYVQNSVQVEVDELNAHGGLLGTRVDVVTADDAMQPDRAGEVARQLLADRFVKLLVGPSVAGLFLAAKPAIARARTPNCVALMAADDVMRDAPYSFRTQEQDSLHIPALLDYVHRGTQIKKIGLIAEGDVFGTDYDRQLNELAPQNGIQYVGPLFVAPGVDQKSAVQQMLLRGADAVIVSNNPATAARTFAAITQLKATAKLKTLGFSGLDSYAFPQQVGDAVNGLIFVSTTQTYLSDVPEARWLPGYRGFVDSVVARYGRAPNGVEMKGTPSAADCVFDWARAVQAANDFDGARVTRAWEALDLPAQQTRLAVREKFTSTDHEAVAADGVGVYQWVKTGDRWSLRQLVGPAA